MDWLLNGYPNVFVISVEEKQRREIWSEKTCLDNGYCQVGMRYRRRGWATIVLKTARAIKIYADDEKSQNRALKDVCSQERRTTGSTGGMGMRYGCTQSENRRGHRKERGKRRKSRRRK
jgi:hypothetical protein